MMALTERQKTALELMFKGDMSISEIALCVKVSRNCLYKWLNNEEFKEEYNRRQRIQTSTLNARLSRSITKAVKRADRILTQSTNDVAAAKVIKAVLDSAGYKHIETLKSRNIEPVQIVDV